MDKGEHFDKQLLASIIRQANIEEGVFVDCEKCSKTGLLDGAECPECNGYGLSIPYGEGDDDEQGEKA